MKQLRYKNWKMTALFLLVIAANVWLMQQSFLYRDGASLSKATTPDAFMTDVEYTSFDTQGEWNNRIQSARVTHYPDKDTSKLISPKLVARVAPLTWIVTAQNGTAQQGLKNIYLTDQVQVDRIHVKQGKTLTLLTDTLTAYPQQKLAQTDQLVTIIQPNSTVHAKGLTADMNTGEIHLLSKVKGNYEKP